jgi:hypothetical protein
MPRAEPAAAEKPDGLEEVQAAAPNERAADCPLPKDGHSAQGPPLGGSPLSRFRQRLAGLMQAAFDVQRPQQALGKAPPESGTACRAGAQRWPDSQPQDRELHSRATDSCGPESGGGSHATVGSAAIRPKPSAQSQLADGSIKWAGTSTTIKSDDVATAANQGWQPTEMPQLADRTARGACAAAANQQGSGTKKSTDPRHPALLAKRSMARRLGSSDAAWKGLHGTCELLGPARQQQLWQYHIDSLQPGPPDSKLLCSIRSCPLVQQGSILDDNAHPIDGQQVDLMEDSWRCGTCERSKHGLSGLTRHRPRSSDAECFADSRDDADLCLVSDKVPASAAYAGSRIPRSPGANMTERSMKGNGCCRERQCRRPLLCLTDDDSDMDDGLVTGDDGLVASSVGAGAPGSVGRPPIAGVAASGIGSGGLDNPDRHSHGLWQWSSLREPKDCAVLRSDFHDDLDEQEDEHGHEKCPTLVGYGQHIPCSGPFIH